MNQSITTLLNDTVIECFRCDSCTWEAIDNDNARCRQCHEANHEAHGVARREEGNVIHVHVRNDIPSEKHSQWKYGSKRYMIKVSYEGDEDMTYLSSIYRDFEVNIENLLNRENIPCPNCGNCGIWIYSRRYFGDRINATCARCFNTSGDKNGIAKCPRGTSLLVEIYIYDLRERLKLNEYYLYFFQGEGQNKWTLVEEDVKEPECD